MMDINSYQSYDGLGLAQIIKEKQVKPEEVLEAAIKTIESINPKLNAVINKMYDQARESTKIKTNKGMFAGVPILLKDITQEMAGEKITSGSKSLQNYYAKQDTFYVKKIKETGVAILGRTNVPEFALMGITEPKLYGPTRNPWNVDHTPGGSSGGSAAAVASGMVPIAGANDGGGSIRIPAAYCGLFGLKPTRGRTPVGPSYGRHWQGASVDHVLTKTVRDSAAMLDQLKIVEKSAAFHAIPYENSYLQLLDKPFNIPLKIAFSVQSPIGTEVHTEYVSAVIHTVKLLESMGHHVEEVQAPVNGDKIAKSYFTMYFGEVAANLATLDEVIGRPLKRNDVEPTTWLLGLIGKSTTAEEFVLGLREWDTAAFQMEEFHEQYDIYLTPTTAMPPAKIGELEPSAFENFMIQMIGKLGWGGLLKKTGMVDQIARDNLKWTPFTQLANLTGQPAMTVPLHITNLGLPIGVQFMAARGKEDLLINLAGVLEKTNLWKKGIAKS